jgi:hypothetical protein
MYASDILNLTFFPIGIILQFSGSEYTRLTSARTEDKKVIWTLCNGINVNGITVPNLVDKFLRGAASSGTENGADSYPLSITTANLPSHNHGVTSLPVSDLSTSGLSIATSGGHVHTVNSTTTALEGGRHDHSNVSGSTTSDSGGHTHTASGTTDGMSGLSSGEASTTTSGRGLLRSDGACSGRIGRGTTKYDGVVNTTEGGGGGYGITIDLAHTHTFTGNTPAVGLPNCGTHSHGVSVSVSDSGGHVHTVNSTTTTDGGGTHSHEIGGSITGGSVSGTTDSAGGGTALTINTLPSYYTVVYIIKVA